MSDRPSQPLGWKYSRQLVSKQFSLTPAMAVALFAAALFAGVTVGVGEGTIAEALTLTGFIALPLMVIAALIERRAWPAHDISATLLAEASAEWRARTNSRFPMSRVQARRWLGSTTAAGAPRTLRATAMAIDWQFAEATAELERIPDDAAPRDLADREALRAQIWYLQHGRADLSGWRAAIGQLDSREARAHRLTMAMIEAAAALGRGEPWQPIIAQAHAQHGPWAVPVRYAAYKWFLRLGIPVLASGMTIALGMVAAAFGL